jgi:hypothetical protein
MKSPHLLLALSGHGYGHLAQCAPVANALRADIPELQLSVCSELPREVLAERLDGLFAYRCVELDPVLRMFNAWEVDVPASQQVYRGFHAHWEAGLQQDVELLRQFSPDVVLADIPYRILLAAAQLDMTAVAMCSLNWADIYAAYCKGDRADRHLLAQMMSGYRAAHTFLTPQPAMPMPQLDNTRVIGPIARRGVRQKALLCKQSGIAETMNIVLVALGGIVTEMPLQSWPRMDDTVWLFTTATGRVKRDDLLQVSALGLPYIDVLASVDLVLTKPGYGTYAEAVCNAVPVLSIERPDWPETAVLNQWAQQHGHLELMTREQFYSGTFVPQVRSLLAKNSGTGMHPAGIKQAAALIQSLLPAAIDARGTGLSG